MEGQFAHFPAISTISQHMASHNVWCFLITVRAFQKSQFIWDHSTRIVVIWTYIYNSYWASCQFFLGPSRGSTSGDTNGYGFDVDDSDGDDDADHLANQRRAVDDVAPLVRLHAAGLLHPAMRSRAAEAAYLQAVVRRFLPHLLRPPTVLPVEASSSASSPLTTTTPFTPTTPLADQAFSSSQFYHQAPTSSRTRRPHHPLYSVAKWVALEKNGNARLFVAWACIVLPCAGYFASYSPSPNGSVYPISPQQKSVVLVTM